MNYTIMEYIPHKDLEKIKGVITNGVILEHSGIFKEYSSVQDAINSAVENDIIRIGSNFFNEDIELPAGKNNITIIGIDKKISKINSLTVYSKDNYIANITVVNDLKTLCQEPCSQYTANEFYNCYFLGNIYLGTELVKSNYVNRFVYCHFGGYNKEFVINNRRTDSIPERDRILFSMIIPNIFNDILNDGGYSLKFYDGQIMIEQCERVLFLNVNFYYPQYQHLFQFLNCTEVFIDNLITGGFTDKYTVIDFQMCPFVYIGPEPTGGQTAIINGKVEFNMKKCGWVSRNDNHIEFNSTTLSRWYDVHQLTYGTNATLYGTGLARLIVSYSIFHFAEPIGLHPSSSFNTWNAVIDY